MTSSYEDIPVGFSFRTRARTITEADITAFAMLTGDWMPLHVDAEYAATSEFGQRAAHGVLGLAISTGFFTQTPEFQRMQPAIIGLLGLTWKFTGPIFIGDTISMTVTVTDKRVSRSNPNRGILHISREVLNQRGEVVQKGETPILVHTRAGLEARKR